MPITTTRAKDYNFPETSAGVFSDPANADYGVTKNGVLDLFMGPVSITSIQAEFVLSGGTQLYTYLKIYDSVHPASPGAATGLEEPLWVIPLWSAEEWMLTFPDGYTFTNGISFRATTTGGTGEAGTDVSPTGTVDVRVIGRKS